MPIYRIYVTKNAYFLNEVLNGHIHTLASSVCFELDSCI